MNNDVKQMNTVVAIIVALVISMFIYMIIGSYWFPIILNYPINHLIPLTYLLYPLCKNSFNYKVAYPSTLFIVRRIIVAIMWLMVFNLLHPIAEQIRMNEINYK